MDEYLQKYLDGDLTDEEASTFERALANDPELDRELHNFERILAVAREDAQGTPPESFTDDVMSRIAGQSHARPRQPQRSVHVDARTWTRRVVWAAGVAVVFMMGYMVANRDSETVPSAPWQSTGITEMNGDTRAPGGLRLARLVYVPENPDVRDVAVAGTFNGWNPEVTAMIQRGDVWVVQLLLPPETYEYMFVEDGRRWVTDPLATQTRDDGFGRTNAVLNLEI
jgi:hypothetical protein